ncbi:hypothetical protein CEXT_34661 [Caerostris extrusa]|uniref:BTB/POZ domain-containing protein 9 n=1 Tax=Caerostris extrusa TaxID=172846 RepID=A0AAV4Y5F2_CAEEX|nr:hypothetical protein CEXT_34661 [Caerostris extrusa]
MSDSHHLGTAPSLGEVEHISHLSENIGSLFWNENYSDITLLIEGHRIPGHKVILASRSEYFRAFYYTMEEMVLEILGLAHQYNFVELETAISDYLKAILNIRNVCMIYDMASLFNLSSLEVCCSFVDRNALDIIHHESFLSLSASGLKEMISRDSFCASEVDIFRAVCEWAQQNPDADMEDILSAVRLPLMALPELLNVVRPTGMVSPDTILDAIKARTESRDTDLNYRGFLMPEENVASPKHGAQVLHGELRSALLDGDVHTYDMERGGFTRHSIDDNNGQGILVMLGKQCIINHMKILLWDRDMRSYSYFVEVSVDQKDWVRVVDHTQYLCRSWQQLYFKTRVVRYIKIVGTHNTVNRVFHVVSFECMYTNRPFRLEKFTYPVHNVATVAASAWVIEGVSRSRNALINGDTENYDWDSGYTCHQLGSGAIVVQLAQPFILDSMRILLWDCDARSYSYYIEVSTDQTNWHIVVDKRKEACRGWQLISFPSRPVVFVRIVGTHNTANEVFHCVHFECPAQVPLSSSANSSSSSLTDVAAINLDEMVP